MVLTYSVLYFIYFKFWLRFSLITTKHLINFRIFPKSSLGLAIPLRISYVYSVCILDQTLRPMFKGSKLQSFPTHCLNYSVHKFQAYGNPLNPLNNSNISLYIDFYSPFPCSHPHFTNILSQAHIFFQNLENKF